MSVTSKQTKTQIQKGNRDERGVRRVDNKDDKDAILFDAVNRMSLHAMDVITSKHAGGRPRKYETPLELLDAVNSYFEYISAEQERGAQLIPDVEGLCAFIGISRDTLNDWQNTRGDEFSVLIKAIKNNIAAAKKQLGLAGKIPPIVLALDFNNNHGYIQQQKIDITASRSWDDMPDSSDISRRLIDG